MGFVPFDAAVKAEMVFEQEGQVVENVYHYALDTDPELTAMRDLAAAIEDHWAASMRWAFGAGITLKLIRVTNLSEQNAPSIEHPVTKSPQGVEAAEMLPLNCCVQVGLKTNYRGRSYRGRVFLPGQVETWSSGSYWSQAHIDSVALTMGEMLSHPTTVGPAVLCVASRVHNGVERAKGVLTAVTDIIVSRTVTSQRRRLPGRGT